MLKKVISGCQTGADEAGLEAAKNAGIPTGGEIAQGCMTLKGPRPDLLQRYNLKECEKKGYPPRTYANARDSDGTLRFAKNFNSAGEICTLNAIKKYNKVYLDIDINDLPDPELIIQWIIDNGIETLNIAGNSEKTAPGIASVVFNFLTKVFMDKQIFKV